MNSTQLISTHDVNCVALPRKEPTGVICFGAGGALGTILDPFVREKLVAVVVLAVVAVVVVV